MQPGGARHQLLDELRGKQGAVVGEAGHLLSSNLFVGQLALSLFLARILLQLALLLRLGRLAHGLDLDGCVLVILGLFLGAASLLFGRLIVCLDLRSPFFHFTITTIHLI